MPLLGLSTTDHAATGRPMMEIVASIIGIDFYTNASSFQPNHKV